MVSSAFQISTFTAAGEAEPVNVPTARNALYLLGQAIVELTKTSRDWRRRRKPVLQLHWQLYKDFPPEEVNMSSLTRGRRNISPKSSFHGEVLYRTP